VIDEGSTLLHARERTIGANRDRAQIVVIADARHDKIPALGGGLRRWGRLSAEFLGPCLRLGRRPVEYRDLVATFLHQMSCHGETHSAETEKSDFSHVCNLGVLPALGKPDRVWRGAGAGSILETGSAADVERAQ
jgi:hypothetical protein